MNLMRSRSVHCPPSYIIFMPLDSTHGDSALDACLALWNQERPDPSIVGIALTALSLLVIGWLARAKERTARDLGSRALAADAVQTWGVPLALGDRPCWHWRERTARLVVGRPVAALALCVFLVKEAREAWRGEAHLDDPAR